jgi:hypothetical protein
MLKWRRAGMVGLYGMPLMTLMALGGGDFHLPGSQPNPGAYHFQSTELCSYCHGDSQYAYNPDTGKVLTRTSRRTTSLTSNGWAG